MTPAGVQLGEGEHGRINVTGSRGSFQARTRLKRGGRLVVVTATGHTRHAAERALLAKLRSLDHGITTVDALVEAYREDAPRTHRHSPRTILKVVEDYRNLLQPTIGQLHPGELTTARCHAAIDSARSPRHADAALRALLRTAMLRGVIEHSPLAGVGYRHAPTRRKPRLLTVEELEAMEAAFTARRDVLRTKDSDPDIILDAFYLLRSTGMRIGELLALRAQDADPENHTISIRGTITDRLDADGKVREFRQEHGKTQAALRTLTLPLGPARRVIARRVAAAPGPDAPLLPSRNGKFLTTHNLRTRWRRALDDGAPALREVSTHILRHTVATTIVREAVKEFGYHEGLERARLQLGHASFAALRHYLDRTDFVVDNSYLLEAVNPEVTLTQRLWAALREVAPTVQPGYWYGAHVDFVVATEAEAETIRQRWASAVTVEVRPSIAFDGEPF